MTLVDGTCFYDLLKVLEKEYGEPLKPYLFEKDGKTLASHIMFMVNGRNVRALNCGKTLLRDEDLVTILLPCRGRLTDLQALYNYKKRV